MKSILKKIQVATLCAAVMAPSVSNAGVGLITLATGGGGGIAILGAGLALGSVPITMGICGAAQFVAPRNSSWRQEDNCGLIINLMFWPGIALLDAEQSKIKSNSLNEIANHIENYGASAEDAASISDLIYNHVADAVRHSSTSESKLAKQVPISINELREVTSSEFQASPGFNRLADDLGAN